MGRPLTAQERVALRKLSRDSIGQTAPSPADGQAVPSSEKPASNATKAELVEWLADQGIAASERETKAGLLEKVENV